MPTMRIAAGKTQPGATDWQVYNPTNASPPEGITVVVDTTSGKFNGVPVYVASLGGRGGHFRTTGGSSIYAATSNSFAIYLRWAEQTPNMPDLTPALANDPIYEYHILWHGIEE